MSRGFVVYVLEIAILTVKLDRISKWEIWNCYNTRGAAIAARERESGRFKDNKVPKQLWRIRKYVPDTQETRR
jgi:hypothetical protein